jgi:hypothetical protein
LGYYPKQGEKSMRSLPMRLFGLMIMLIFAGITYYNWQTVLSEGTYSMKMAVLAPAGAIGGLFIMLFPGRGGRPNTTRDQFLVLLVFGIGLAAGIYNLYLMDPGYFGR